MNVMGKPVIGIAELTRRFGTRKALSSVSLSIPRGGVFGLVGANGAGKTTLIKHILGLLRAEDGSVRVFGLDPVADPVRVLSRVGYLSEENDLPGWMRVDELIRYTRAFYPDWDDRYADELLQTFRLDPAARVRNLSKGQKARAGLLIALAYRPELLVLDEPSSGLDPIVRRDILGAILRTIAHEGRTVLFSSHLLDEVEEVADHVTMISRGRIVLSSPLDELLASHRTVDIHFATSTDSPPDVTGVLHWDNGNGSGHEWTAVTQRASGEIEPALEGRGGRVVAQRTPSLDEIFVAYVGLDPTTDVEP